MNNNIPLKADLIDIDTDIADKYSSIKEFISTRMITAIDMGRYVVVSNSWLVDLTKEQEKQMLLLEKELTELYTTKTN